MSGSLEESRALESFFAEVDWTPEEDGFGVVGAGVVGAGVAGDVGADAGVVGVVVVGVVVVGAGVVGAGVVGDGVVGVVVTFWSILKVTLTLALAGAAGEDVPVLRHGGFLLFLVLGST